MNTVTISKREYNKLKAAYEKQKLLEFLNKRAEEAERSPVLTRKDLGF